MTTTVRWAMPYINADDTNAEVSHNAALDTLQIAVGLLIADRGENDPPTIVEGEVYVVGPSPTGVWVGHDGELAIGLNGAWQFLEPPNGAPFFIEDEGCGGVYMNGFVVRNPSPRFSAQRSATQAFSGETDIEWNSQIQIDGYFQHSTSVDADEITIEKAGVHSIDATITVSVASGSGLTNFRIRLYSGGAAVTNAVVEGWINNTQSPITVNLSRDFNVAGDGDKVKLSIERIAGSSNLQVDAGSCVRMRRE